MVMKFQASFKWTALDIFLQRMDWMQINPNPIISLEAQMLLLENKNVHADIQGVGHP